MSDCRFVFLDFDDTISDQFRFNLQYVRQIGAVLAPQFGGEIEDWGKAAADMLETIERDYIARFRGLPLNGYCTWLDAIRPWCADLLFGAMKRQTPHDARELSLRTMREALQCCDATYPGVHRAMEEMTTHGCMLYMASGQESAYLDAALGGAKISHHVRRSYGPDLIDCAKEGPEYYERIFAACNVDPRHALVVDDSPEAIIWALHVGANVIQSKLSHERHFDIVPDVAGVITDMAELPALAESVFSSSKG